MIGTAPEPRAKKDRVLKLEIQPAKGEISASTEKLVVENVLSERPNGVETTIMWREKFRAEKKLTGEKQGLGKGVQEKKARELKDAMESSIRQQDENQKPVDVD
jgi:hypothetical protein